MRIGIDAKWYFTGPVSTRVVLQNLLPALFSLYPEQEWIVLLDRKDRPLGIPFSQKNVEVRYVWAGNNMLSNVFILPYHLKKTKAQVALFQTFPSLTHSIPSIAFIHDVLFREFPQFFTWKEKLYFKPLQWLTRHRADRLIATTRFVAGDLLKYKYARGSDRIDIVPLAVSPLYTTADDMNPKDLAATRRKFGLPDRYILFVGRLNVRKNIENLLKALPLLEDKDIPLVIVGKEDWKAPELKESLSNPSVRQRILMTGAMSDEELKATYAQASVFCFPSFAEGFGLPPLEAMASGIPAIVAKTTALPEVCGEAAIYIDPHDPQSIAKALDQLLSDRTLCHRQKQLGLERAAQFTWTASAHALMQSIQNTVKTFHA